MLTESECSEVLTRLLRPYFAKVDVQNVYHDINKGHSIEEDSNLITLLIQEHFSNPPLLYGEIEEGKWYWHNKKKEWVKILNKDVCTYSDYPIIETINEYIEFELDCFYRKQVEE